MPPIRPLDGSTLPQINAYSGQQARNQIGGMDVRVKTSSPTGTPASGAENTRMRVNRACDRCRSHKIKCTGAFPCPNCTKHRVECCFGREEPGSKRAKLEKRDMTEVSAPPPSRTLDNSLYFSQALPILDGLANRSDPSYTQYLENRVHYLESLLLESLTATFKSIGTVNPDVEDINDLFLSLLTKWRFCRRHQNALVIELCKSLYEGLSPSAREQVQLPRTQYFGWNMSGCNYLKPEPLPPLPAMDAFSEDAHNYYVDFFFAEINPLYAILHEAVFREQLAAFRRHKSAVSQTNSTALFLAMLCLVYSLAIRFAEFAKPEGPTKQLLHLEESLFKYSHRVVLIFSFEWESFELIQCWLLVTLYLRVAHRQTSANNAAAHAVSMCRSMSLGRPTQVVADVTPYELVKAKRIFYAVYCFDRIIGLQGGRQRALNEFDITRPFPLLDYAHEADDWLTLPAFAMMHIARIANLIHTGTYDNYDLVRAQQINKELHLLGQWLTLNGFDDTTDIFPQGGDVGGVSLMVRAQVKLHYYDLLIAMHGKLLFTYLGRRIATEGTRVEKVLEANEGIVYILKKIHAANKLYAPWYLNLLLLFGAGINCLVFINAGVFLTQLRRLMRDIMDLLQYLHKSPVTADGKLVFRERFKMVGECVWVLKMTNHIMALSFEESIRTIHDWGIDHGSADVNKQFFSQFGLMNTKANAGELDRVMADQNKRMGPTGMTTENETLKNELQENTEASPGSSTSQPHSSSYGVEELLCNLQWFDQWLDFNQEI